MPRIFDNIEENLLPALQETIALCERADFCVGYFNLRGWQQLHDNIEKWHGGDGHCCRLLVGMQQMPQDQLRQAMGSASSGDQIDQATAIALNLSDTLVTAFPAPSAFIGDAALDALGRNPDRDLRRNAERMTINTKGGDTIAYDEVFAWRSKTIIDEIDRVLGKHYGFTDEELDFIINYDIKYRMGGAEEGEEEG